MRSVSRGMDRIEVLFDEPNLVANASLLLVATLVARLSLESLIDHAVRLRGRGTRPGEWLHQGPSRGRASAPDRGMVPSVEGAITLCGSTAWVDPARSTSAWSSVRN